MRSPVWFVVAAVIAVAGFAGAVFYLMPRLAAADARMMRVVVPGNAMLVFDQPGRYRLAANLASGRGDPKVVLAIDQGMFRALLGTILGAIAIAFAGLGIAGAIVFAVLWQRSKAAKSVATD
jgi:hypothetical protein